MNPRTALSIVCGLGLSLAAFAASPTYMSVQVKDGVIRATASPFGKPVAKLQYGDLVEVQGTTGAWVQVRGYGNVQGWLHQNTLTKKKLITGTGTAQANAGASSSEVALAGKGFNSTLEKDLRGKNQSLDFKTMDQMETWKVSDNDSLQFLRDGGVKPQGGSL
jgi:hypothetical protein